MSASQTLLKVCGLRDGDTATACAGLDIDYIGLVFAKSKRQVNAEQAQVIMNAYRASGGKAKFAGVFVNPSLQELTEVMETSPLDVIQLHGSESVEDIEQCRTRFPKALIWKAIGVSGELSHTEEAVATRLKIYEGSLDALLLDAYDPHVGGGTGKTFRWDVIPLYKAWADKEHVPLFIAGGLHIDNVSELLKNYAVAGIDVSSGVETDGKKDIEKIHNFVKRVKPS